VQAALTQVGAALTVLHAFPHAPQLPTSLERSVSQPLLAT
jgi:hypothetical protein